MSIVKLKPSINLEVIYGGVHYKSQSNHYLKSVFLDLNKRIIVDNLPHLITGVYDEDTTSVKRIEDDKSIKLFETKRYLDIDFLNNNEIYLFDKEELLVNYNKETKEFDNNYDISKLNLNNTFISGTIIDIYMDKLKDINPYLYKELINIDESEYLSNHDHIAGFLMSRTVSNFIKIIDNELTFEFEKALKINPGMTIEKLKSEDITKESLSQITGISKLPSNVLEFIEVNEYSRLIEPLQLLDVNGNDYNILIEFFENSAILVHPSNRESDFTDFTELLVDIMRHHDYSMANLLDFIIREEIFTDGDFDFPLNTAILFNDYLSMCEQLGIESKKYPDIVIDHNILMRNVSYLEKIDENDFIEVVNGYKNLIDEFKNEEYILITPKSIEDMIEEGNDLSHCVASYTNNVLNGNSKIFFLRKKDNPYQSLVTIELDSDNNLNHARGKFNREVDEEEKVVINEWLKNI